MKRLVRGFTVYLVEKKKYENKKIKKKYVENLHAHAPCCQHRLDKEHLLLDSRKDFSILLPWNYSISHQSSLCTM